MKRVLALAFAILVAVAFAVPAVAGDKAVEKSSMKHEWAKGTISAWDEATKTFTVKDETGKDWSFSWNDKTMIHGTSKVGETVKLNFTKDPEGKMWAHHVYVGKDEIMKAEKEQEKKKMEKAGGNE